jgi:glycosyltransferase involved in cell wall biosynthesis
VKKKILFIVAHRLNRSPGQRFRFEQYLDFLEKNNFEFEISYIINEKDDETFYQKGQYFRKFLILLKSIKQRFRDLKKANNFDIIFIYREAFMLGSVFFEKRFAKSNAKIIVDFDDAIWLRDVSQGNNNLAWLKHPAKTSKIVKYADLVLVGNSYLANYASNFNSNVKIIPTTLDTDNFKKVEPINESEKICIGWTGSSTTLKHFETAVPVLKKIKEKYKEKVWFKLISDFPFFHEDIEIEQCKWNNQTETIDLSVIDIGIMPLPDDDWSKGKCGFKALQYMTLGIPTIMSPVGVNVEIVEDGINGFLANSIDEWVSKLSLLIESKKLREKLGKKGRETVENRYSFNSQKEKYLQLFNELIETKNA